MLTDRDWRKVQALQDMGHALSALTFFAEIGEQTTEIERRRFRCYHDSAVVAYCRPFTQSNGLPTLSLGDLGIRPTSQERALHKRLMIYRNKVVAHTDADRMRLLLTSFEISGGIAFPQITKEEGYEFLNDIDALEVWFRKLKGALGKWVFAKAQELPIGARMIRDYLEPESNDPDEHPRDDEHGGTGNRARRD